MLRSLTSEVRARLVLLLGMEVIVGLMANRIFDRFIWPFLVVIAFGAAAVVTTANASATVKAAVGILTAAGAVALCSWWAGGPFVNLNLASGARELLTTEWPSPATPESVAMVGLTLALIVMTSSFAAMRPSLHLLPLLPISLGAIGAAALSSGAGPDWSGWLIGSAFAIAFAMVHHGTDLRTRTSAIASERSLVFSIALLAIAGTIGTLAIPDDAERADPRQLNDPTTSTDLVDPIEAATAMRNREPSLDLFRIENRSTLIGSVIPSYWRLTALTDYDGQRWLPDSALRPIGRRLSSLPPNSPVTQAPISFSVTIETTQLSVLPFPGQPLRVSTDVETDRDRVIVQLQDRPEPGTVIEASSLVQPTRSEVGGRQVSTQPVDEIAGTFTDVASEIAGEGTGIEQLTTLETTMRDQWKLDPTSPGAGQQQALLDRFIRETKRGTREQFATAFVLLSRSLGYESRVATGFVVPPEQTGTTAVINSSQAAVWPEVHVSDIGWIRFDPVPPRLAEQSESNEPQQQAQSPAAPQPPIAPPAEQVDRDDQSPDPTPTGNRRFAAIGRAVATALTYSAIILLPLGIVFGGIIGIKALRRRRRLQNTDPVSRVRAAWANTTDAFVDAGLAIPQSSTNLQIADSARPLAPTAPAQVERLAELSTTVTFGSSVVSDEVANNAAEMSNTVRSSIAENMGRWQRYRWMLSLRSLRRRTRSPVVP